MIPCTSLDSSQVKRKWSSLSSAFKYIQILTICVISSSPPISEQNALLDLQLLLEMNGHHKEYSVLLQSILQMQLLNLYGFDFDTLFYVSLHNSFSSTDPFQDKYCSQEHSDLSGTSSPGALSFHEPSFSLASWLLELCGRLKSE